MTIPNLRDIEAIDPEGFETLVAGLSRKAGNAAMRELGYTDAIERTSPGRRTRQPQCAHDGCSKFRKLGVKYCADHADLEAVPF